MNLLGVQMNNYFIITTSGSLKRLLSNSPTNIYWLFCDKTIDKSRNIDMQSILKKIFDKYSILFGKYENRRRNGLL